MKVSKFRNFLTNKYASWFDKWHRYKEKRKKEKLHWVGHALMSENVTLPSHSRGRGVAAGSFSLVKSGKLRGRRGREGERYRTGPSCRESTNYFSLRRGDVITDSWCRPHYRRPLWVVGGRGTGKGRSPSRVVERWKQQIEVLKKKKRKRERERERKRSPLLHVGRALPRGNSLISPPLPSPLLFFPPPLPIHHRAIIKCILYSSSCGRGI